LHRAARNNCDYYNGTGSDQSVADAVENAAQDRWVSKENSAEDGGFN
jgi:hypothetical protein